MIIIKYNYEASCTDIFYVEYRVHVIETNDVGTASSSGHNPHPSHTHIFWVDLIMRYLVVLIFIPLVLSKVNAEKFIFHDAYLLMNVKNQLKTTTRLICAFSRYYIFILFRILAAITV